MAGIVVVRVVKVGAAEAVDAGGPAAAKIEVGDVLIKIEGRNATAAELRRIAEQGPDGFYRGATADLIVAEMERGGGLIISLPVIFCHTAA